MPSVHQISISDGGVPKRPVANARIDRLGVVGDHQDDKRHHGGPDRALCLYSLEVIEALQEEGHPIKPGSAGENLTIQGLDWTSVVPGVALRIGPATEIEVSSYTSPCRKNAGWFLDGDYTRMSQHQHPGESRVYARVIAPGVVSTDDEVRLV